MPVLLESSNDCVSPVFEEAFDDCGGWLQFDEDQATSQGPRSTSPSMSRNTLSLFIDIQEWTLQLSPPLSMSDIQSPRSFRPYGTPITRESPSAQIDGCYFDFRHEEIQEVASSITSYSEKTTATEAPTWSDSNVDYAMTLPYNFNHLEEPTAKEMKDGKRPCLFENEPRRANRKDGLSIEGPVRIKRYGGASNVDAGMIVEWGKLPQRRSCMDDKRKLSYRDTRRKGACSNCRRKRRRCDRSMHPYIECLITPKSLTFLDHPVDARLFRLRPAAGHPLASEKPDLYALNDLGSRGVNGKVYFITQGLNVSLPVQLCYFEPDPNLMTCHVFRTLAGPRRIQMPRICLADVETAKRSLEIFIKDSWCLRLQDIMLKLDPITQVVLQEAQKYAINHPQTNACLVHRALMLIAANRMIEQDWAFTGPEVPGIDVVDDKQSPWYGTRPITPAMDTQLDQIIIQTFLMPLRERLLEDLQEKIILGKKKDWFEVFLTIFILQTNTALLLRHSRKNAIRYGASGRYNSIPLAEGYFHGSNILLTHFHYGCGIAGVLRTWQTDGSSGLSREQNEFLSQLIPAIRARRAQWEIVHSTKQYEADGFWSYQMFFEGWRPESKMIADV